MPQKVNNSALKIHNIALQNMCQLLRTSHTKKKGSRGRRAFYKYIRCEIVSK